MLTLWGIIPGSILITYTPKNGCVKRSLAPFAQRKKWSYQSPLSEHPPPKERYLSFVCVTILKAVCVFYYKYETIIFEVRERYSKRYSNKIKMAEAKPFIPQLLLDKQFQYNQLMTPKPENSKSNGRLWRPFDALNSECSESECSTPGDTKGV